MRRSASEVINDLEMRIAQLEKQSSVEVSKKVLLDQTVEIQRAAVKIGSLMLNNEAEFDALLAKIEAKFGKVKKNNFEQALEGILEAADVNVSLIVAVLSKL
jgi:hypothetical protein